MLCALSAFSGAGVGAAARRAAASSQKNVASDSKSQNQESQINFAAPVIGSGANYDEMSAAERTYRELTQKRNQIESELWKVSNQLKCSLDSLASQSDYCALSCLDLGEARNNHSQYTTVVYGTTGLSLSDIEKKGNDLLEVFHECKQKSDDAHRVLLVKLEEAKHITQKKNEIKKQLDEVIREQQQARDILNQLSIAAVGV
jgi:hypothetical protein